MSMFLFLNLELLLRASPGMPAIVLFLNTCVIVQYHKKKKSVRVENYAISIFPQGLTILYIQS